MLIARAYLATLDTIVNILIIIFHKLDARTMLMKVTHNKVKDGGEHVNNLRDLKFNYKTFLHDYFFFHGREGGRLSLAQE